MLVIESVEMKSVFGNQIELKIPEGVFKFVLTCCVEGHYISLSDTRPMASLTALCIEDLNKVTRLLIESITNLFSNDRKLNLYTIYYALQEIVESYEINHIGMVSNQAFAFTSNILRVHQIVQIPETFKYK